MKLYIAKSEEGSIIYFSGECGHKKKIIRFDTNDVLVACKNEKKPIALYLYNTPPEEAVDFVKYFIEKSFLSEITDSPYLKSFLESFSDVDEIVFI